MMTKICTDVEQSNKLIEFGIDVNTADMCYHFIEINKTPLCIRWEKVHDDEKDNSIPCWSLAALLEQLPYEVCDDDGNSFYLQIYKENDCYQLAYTDPYEDFESMETNRYEYFVDACYNLILKLHELNLL